jgi:hypothetical protein
MGAVKRHAPDLEDARFAMEVNEKLPDGTRIDMFSLEPEGAAREYKLVMCSGGYRRTISSDSPFPFAGVADIVERVTRWLGTLEHPNSKWSDDPRYA